MTSSPDFPTILGFLIPADGQPHTVRCREALPGAGNFGAGPVHLRPQLLVDPEIEIFMRHDPAAEENARTFQVYRTDERMPRFSIYRGSVSLADGTTLHLLES